MLPSKIFFSYRMLINGLLMYLPWMKQVENIAWSLWFMNCSPGYDLINRFKVRTEQKWNALRMRYLYESEMQNIDSLINSSKNVSWVHRIVGMSSPYIYGYSPQITDIFFISTWYHKAMIVSLQQDTNVTLNYSWNTHVNIGLCVLEIRVS